MSAPTTLQEAIDLFQLGFAGIDGIKDAPADPPGAPGQFPFISTRVASVDALSNTPEDFRAKWDIAVDFFVGMNSLPESIEALLTFPETILNVIWYTVKNNEIAFGNQVTGDYVDLVWAGAPCVGLTFIIHGVKILHTITTPT